LGVRRRQEISSNQRKRQPTKEGRGNRKKMSRTGQKPFKYKGGKNRKRESRIREVDGWSDGESRCNIGKEAGLRKRET